MTTGPADEQSTLESLIRSGRKDQAVKLLCRLAVAAARANRFEEAERYRDRLYEVDSMALSAIIGVNEIIDREKSKALTPDRRRLWARFFDALEPEEANAFFFALKERRLQMDEILLEQGQPNERLYLIDSGQLKMIHDGDARQLLIRSLGTGDTCGEDTFFSINVCTTSIIALAPCRISFLERDRLDGIKIQYPMLENQLKKVCGGGSRMYDWLRRKGMDRRAFKRINFPTTAWFQVLTPDAKKGMQRPVAAELWDISKGGLSFYFQSKNPQAVRRLVGRTVGVKFILAMHGQRKEVAVTGIVHGVQNHPLDEYSVHVKLQRNFSDQAMKVIRQVAEG